MDITLLFVAGFLSLILIGALAFSRFSVIASILSSVFSLGFAGFCAFGFMACFEPSHSPVWPWQLAYAVLGIGFLAATVRGLTNAWTRIRQSTSAN